MQQQEVLAPFIVRNDARVGDIADLSCDFTKAHGNFDGYKRAREETPDERHNRQTRRGG